MAALKLLVGRLLMSSRRVAVLGMFLESNAFARDMSERGSRGAVYVEGDELTADALAENPRVMGEVSGFYRRMAELGPWEPVPVPYTMSGGGAADHSFFEATVARAVEGLWAAGPLDAVYLCNHGAMITTEEEDGDGTFAEADHTTTSEIIREALRKFLEVA